MERSMADIELQRVTIPAVTYRVGDHTLALACTARWQWTVSVDSRELPNRYSSQAEAWEAGVREAYGCH
jgi:hypothetical protein